MARTKQTSRISTHPGKVIARSTVQISVPVSLPVVGKPSAKAKAGAHKKTVKEILDVAPMSNEKHIGIELVNSRLALKHFISLLEARAPTLECIDPTTNTRWNEWTVGDTFGDPVEAMRELITLARRVDLIRAALDKIPTLSKDERVAVKSASSALELDLRCGHSAANILPADSKRRSAAYHAAFSQPRAPERKSAKTKSTSTSTSKKGKEQKKRDNKRAESADNAVVLNQQDLRELEQSDGNCQKESSSSFGKGSFLLENGI